MSLRFTQVLLGLSLLLNCFVLAGFVYRTWIAPPPFAEANPPPAPHRDNPLERLARDLKLDDRQRQALRGLFDSYADERQDRFRDFRKLREKMADELKKPEFDMTRIDSLVDQMAKLRTESQKQNFGALAQLAEQLRPDQRQHLHAMLAERFGNPPRRPPPPDESHPKPGPAPTRPPQ
ncbi:MAG TPA: periplasmic heavy metal sensor [Reyranella sp.]|nr:periplasmic heavy metal sensor [Reyranella sp.]